MIKDLHKKLVEKEITSVELTKKYLEKIKDRNPEINSFLSVYEKEALAEAKKVDEKIKAGKSIGMLEGIPYAVKDNFCVKGKITTAGSKILENYKAPYDNFVIGKLKKAGAILLGKTNLDEFAMGTSTENSAFGVTKNPVDTERVAGGSSGGSAAAVADEQAVWSLGSDTGGSIRCPASFCGVVGMKPTYGRVSRAGIIAMASSYDQIGPFTQTVEDTAIILDEICDKDPKDNTTVVKETRFFNNLKPEIEGKKIGVLKDFMGEDVNPEIKKIIKEKIDWARKNGAEVMDIEIPGIKYSLAVYYLMICSEVSSNLARFDGIRYGKQSSAENILDTYLKSRDKYLGDEVKRRIILGTYSLSAGYKDAYYKKAQEVRNLIKQGFKEAFEEVDLILTPTMMGPAFKIGEKCDDPLELYLVDISTVPVNVAMLPAISINAGYISTGGKKLPIGMQLIGPWWQEQSILNTALAFEEGFKN
jgi:aspartyl-tRNA(Asn)/glutamyl-tRNA(Gln) amidotransferase subunit A